MKRKCIKTISVILSVLLIWTSFASMSLTASALYEDKLQVDAIANYTHPFGEMKFFDKSTDKITVAFWLKGSLDFKKIESAVWTLNYDPEVLKIDETEGVNFVYDKDGEIEYDYISRISQHEYYNDASVNISTPGRIKGVVTNIKGYDISEAGTPFVTVTFDVVDHEKSYTEVLLDVDTLVMLNRSNEEVMIVRDGELINISAINSEITINEGTFDDYKEEPEALYINAKSNLGNYLSPSKTYYPETNQFTVTYWVDCDYDLISAQWQLTYDSDKLILDDTPGANFVYKSDGEVNYPLIFRPTIINNKNRCSINSPDTGVVKGAVSDIYGFPLNDNGDKVPLITVTFKAKDNAVGRADVDLKMQVMTVGLEEETVLLFKNYTIQNNNIQFLPTDSDGSITINDGIFGEQQPSTVDIGSCSVTLGQTSYTYDGTEKQPSVTVTYGGKTLTKDTDYTVSYSNNTNAGTATATVTGKGNYSGNKSASFTISPKSIKNTVANLSQTSYIYDGTAKTPTVTITDGSKTLVKDTDYTVSYSNNTNAGTATVTVTGKGNYNSSFTKSFTITEAAKTDISSATVDLGTASYTYDGTAKQPTVTVTYGGKTLTKDTDYTVSYSNNTNAGNATVIVTGKGNYTGNKSANFTISPKSIKNTVASLSQTNYTYDGTAKTPTVTITDGSKTLEKDTDYTVSYSNNTNAGTANVSVTGKGNYNDSFAKTFTISPKSIKNTVASLSQTNFTYDGTAKTPTVTIIDGSKTLAKDTDYLVSYSNNTSVGTATVTVTGNGNYNDSFTKEFTISEAPKVNISYASVKLSSESYTYDGNAKQPSVTVTYGGNTLENGTDYSVSYSKNTNAGTAVVTISGEGGYTGSTSANFTISPKSVDSLTVKLSDYKFEYDGNAKTPSVTVTDGIKTLTSGTDYTVAYSNNTDPGTAFAVVVGINNYSGSKSESFSIEDTQVKFRWGKDNWRFTNSGNYFGDSYYINSVYYNKLMNGLNRLEAEYVRNGLLGEWGGSCYGMATTSILGSYGILNPSQYTNGASYVNDISAPPSGEVLSLINYYFALQFTDYMDQKSMETIFYSQEEGLIYTEGYKIRKILSCLEDNSPTLVGYYWPPEYNPIKQIYETSGHAVVAYGYENEYGTIDGFDYDIKILIYDNRNSGFNNRSCIFVNSEMNYAWYIPYDRISSLNDAFIGLVTDDLNDINYHGYIRGNGGNSSYGGNFYGKMTSTNVKTEINWSKIKTSGSGIQYNAPGDDEIKMFGSLGDTSNYDTFNIAFKDSKSGYSMKLGKAQDQDINMRYENSRIKINTTNTNNLLFDPSGFCMAVGKKTDYTFDVMYNDGYYATDWYNISVSGSAVDEASLTPYEDGYVLEATNLNNVTVNAHNDDYDADREFSTNYTKAYIYEIDEETIGIRVDTDNNGTYETDLFNDQPAEVLYGDVNGDNSIDVLDAIAIQKNSVEKITLSAHQKRAADVNADGVVDILDAIMIQKYTVEKVREFPASKKSA